MNSWIGTGKAIVLLVTDYCEPTRPVRPTWVLSLGMEALFLDHERIDWWHQWPSHEIEVQSLGGLRGLDEL